MSSCLGLPESGSLRQGRDAQGLGHAVLGRIIRPDSADEDGRHVQSENRAAEFVRQ